MERVYRLDGPYALAQRGVIQRRESSPEELFRALGALGREVGREIVERFYLNSETIRTPMDVEVRVDLPRFPLLVAISTKEDLAHFATSLAQVVGNCELGWMDFEGRRGFEALTAEIRQTSFPILPGQRVDSLLVAKAALATGCTAVSLTRTAFGHYLPDRLIIASVFYSIRGLEMLRAEFPNAHIFVVGEPDEINDHGLLMPGIGVLAERLGGG